MRESSKTFNTASASSQVILYEGVLIKLKNSEDIFYVKGISHPQGYVIAFPRYIKQGEKVRILKTYKEQILYAKEKYPEFIKKLDDKEILLIPMSEIEKIYDPVERAAEIRRKPESPDEEIVAELIDILCEAVPQNYVGIVGSRLLGLRGFDHDVDIVVIDYRYAIPLYDILITYKRKYKKLFALSHKDISDMYKVHCQSLRIPFEKYVRTVTRRVLEGSFKGLKYFIRILLMYRHRPVFRIVSIMKLGKILTYAKFSPKIDTVSVTCPCLYFDANVPIVSERGVFTETLRLLQHVKVCGDLEEVVLDVDGELVRLRWIYLGPDAYVEEVS